MAHTCPECGMTCYCNGDIDDIDFGERRDCRCSEINEDCCGYHHDIDDDGWMDCDYYEDNTDQRG